MKTVRKLATTLALLLLPVLGFSQSPGHDAPRPALVWKDGKTRLQFEKAHLELSNRMQLRFTLQDNEGSPTVGSFRVRRFKTKLEGWAYTPDLTFELQLNWAEDKPLEDANVAYDCSHGKKLFVIKAGQFKVPFGRQELTSAGNQQFVDRSIVSNRFARGRDLGLQLSGLGWGGKLDWRLGAFNGAGRNATTNDNGKLQVDARITFQPFGEVKLSEGDLEHTPNPRLALAVQYENNDRRGSAAAANSKLETWGGDATFAWKGLFFFSEFFTGEETPLSGPSRRSRGLSVQGGYTLVPAKVELALRYAVLDPSRGAPGDRRYERGIAANLFFNKHVHKLQADLRQLEDQRLKRRDWEFRLQYQLIF